MAFSNAYLCERSLQCAGTIPHIPIRGTRLVVGDDLLGMRIETALVLHAGLTQQLVLFVEVGIRSQGGDRRHSVDESGNVYVMRSVHFVPCVFVESMQRDM